MCCIFEPHAVKHLHELCAAEIFCEGLASGPEIMSTWLGFGHHSLCICMLVKFAYIYIYIYIYVYREIYIYIYIYI